MTERACIDCGSADAMADRPSVSKRCVECQRKFKNARNMDWYRRTHAPRPRVPRAAKPKPKRRAPKVSAAQAERDRLAVAAWEEAKQARIQRQAERLAVLVQHRIDRGSGQTLRLLEWGLL
ncbi:hypothetical protein GCM10022286_05660 [Gryllotalpicola daejeonensis]|uniref:C2H2-type domain-containing protein n=1 Tax=Gryllotalpicola daejeonensis TaxID=993087 RepID=A0ABP7ZFC5_9MICO